MIYFLLYFLFMLISMALFIWLNQTYKWVTKETYSDSYDIVPAFITVLAIFFYPIAIPVLLGILVWQKFIPEN